MNQKQAAQALGITDRQLRAWRSEDGFPSDAVSGGVWDVRKIREWRDAGNRKGSSSSELSRNLDLALKSEKLKEQRASTRLIEIRLQTAEGKLIPRFAFEAFVTSILSQLGQLCDQLPDILSGELPEEHRDQIRAAAVRELRTWRQNTRQRIDEETRRLDQGAAE